MKTSDLGAATAAAAANSGLEEILGRFTSMQQRFWLSVVDTMNEALVLISPQRHIVYLNRKAEELTGARLGDASGALCTDAIDCPQCSCACRLFDDGEVSAVEVTIYHRDTGKPRTLLKNASLLRDENGHVVCGVETFQDISREVAERIEARRNLDLLYAEKSQKEALLAALPDGVFSVDATGKLLTLSVRMSMLLGVDSESAVGRDLFELLGFPRPVAPGGSLLPLHDRRLNVMLRDGTGAELEAELTLRRVAHRDDEMMGVLRPKARLDCPGAERQGFHGIVSRAPKMTELFRMVESAAESGASILVEGESGTGKELLARAIHALSPRRDEPFYAVNCATFQGALLLSELFGHERGAFTGAYRTAKGKLELAGGGTLFLDEVSQIPLHYQGVLLRVLEQRSFERVGGVHAIPLRARIVSATNERLVEAVRAGRFREDLYYRLKVVPLAVPPLRERPEDLDLLLDYFAHHPLVNLRRKPLRLTDEALAALRAHAWPGNVRELRNLVEYLCFVPDDVIGVEVLPPELRSAAPAAPVGHDAEVERPALALERERLVGALERAGGRRSEAARLLGIDRTTLWRKLYRHGLQDAWR